VLLLTAVGLINRITLPWFLQQTDEFVFRRVPFVGFFYKGDFYICVAVIFLLFDPFRWTKVLAALGIVAIEFSTIAKLRKDLIAAGLGNALPMQATV